MYVASKELSYVRIYMYVFMHKRNVSQNKCLLKTKVKSVFVHTIQSPEEIISFSIDYADQAWSLVFSRACLNLIICMFMVAKNFWPFRIADFCVLDDQSEKSFHDLPANNGQELIS